MEEIRSKLDVDALRSRKTSMPYPHVKLTELNRCIPVVISSLEKGDVPVLGTLNGVTKIVANMSKSALNINKLIKVSNISLVLSDYEEYLITNIVEYMEVANKWI